MRSGRVTRRPGAGRAPGGAVSPLLAVALCLVTACTRDSAMSAPSDASTIPPEATVTSPAPTSPAPSSPAPTGPAPTSPAPSSPVPTMGTVDGEPVATTVPVTATVAPTTSAAPVTPTTTPYAVPVADVASAGWADEHHDYPATDVFVGCGATLVSPVNGTMLEVRRADRFDPAVDNPATRGGRSLSILGDDGVRYYLAHFDTIVDPLAPGDRVAAGQTVGTMGRTGRAGACHVHVAISPPCPGIEWSVRRGVVWPYPYLDAWMAGEQRSPAAEVAAWVDAHPSACADAMADPHAADA